MESIIPQSDSGHSSSSSIRIKHQYGTRIRKNSIIRPSARLRQSPAPPLPPRRIKPAPTPKSAVSPDFPTFPLPHVVLHADDAHSKVFLAIGRSLMSVDNRAMTIKDLAEMTLKFGLICQNVSAAGQAITTYIRTHMHRCEVQGDHPLLLRHTLSGTPTDDDLLPALHSRTGGAHCTVNPQDRATNFRRGTMVWYLSRATGAPCPFARAGISLVRHSESRRAGSPTEHKERQRGKDQLQMQDQRGQKRKRITRHTAAKGSESESTGEEGLPPPKVKLTLRLRPTSVPAYARNTSCTPPTPPSPTEVIDLSKDSDSASDPEPEHSLNSESESESDSDSHSEDPMTVDSSSSDDESDSCASSPELDLGARYRARVPSSAFSRTAGQARPRSRSVPSSMASLPPDSEEDEDFVMDAGVHSRENSPYGTEDWDLDFEDSDREGDAETQWESPGPRSPSAPIMHSPLDQVVVKEEEVQEMLDAWENVNSRFTDAKLIEVIARSTTGSDNEPHGKVKREDLNLWSWHTAHSGSGDWYTRSTELEPGVRVKQEELETSSPFDYDLSSPLTPYSSISSHSFESSNVAPPDLAPLRRHSEHIWKDAEISGPENVRPGDFDEWQGPSRASTVRARARAKTSPNLPSFVPKEGQRASSSICVIPDTSTEATPRASRTVSSLVMPPLPRLLIQAVPGSQGTGSAEDTPTDVVVVHTCQPCVPAISATQVEGISVYQMLLGSCPLFRRIDTDFVNLTTIMTHIGIAPSTITTISNATVVADSSPAITGIWVPLTSAQAFVKEHPVPAGLLDIFLSDILFERFPPALQDFHRSNNPARLLNHFGPHFKSTIEQRRSSQLTIQTESLFLERERDAWLKEAPSGWDADYSRPGYFSSVESLDVVQTPLSATEREIFQSLCCLPEDDSPTAEPEVAISTKLPSPTPAPVVDESPLCVQEEVQEATSKERRTVERPLRRSRRVANAIAATTRPRTRSRPQGTRNSLS